MSLLQELVKCTVILSVFSSNTYRVKNWTSIRNYCSRRWYIQGITWCSSDYNLRTSTTIKNWINRWTSYTSTDQSNWTIERWSSPKIKYKQINSRIWYIYISTRNVIRTIIDFLINQTNIKRTQIRSWTSSSCCTNSNRGRSGT